jgi:hypothetical protein
MKLRDLLGKVATSELWLELAKRLGVRFGKIQMAVHDWKPSKYATVDMKVSTDDESIG